LRWPAAWKDPSVLSLLKGGPFDYLIVEKGAEFDAVRSAARQAGFEIAEPGAAPSGIRIVKGEWPGVRVAAGRGGAASAGPTGVPWVDSNGWNVRLSTALHPESAVWVEASPAANARLTAASYVIAIADSGAYGGRWIVSLDNPLAAGLAAGSAESLETWKAIASAAGFFAAHQAWAEYSPVAVAGVVSDFAGRNEFFGQELLNLLGRAGLHYRILVKKGITGSSFESLRAVLYADAEPPSPALRKQVLAFVQGGGLLITGPQWGAAEGTPAKGDSHPRYALRDSGKGRIAQAIDTPADPYEMAGDAVVLVSHRYDLVRFWNGGATGSYYAAASGRKKAVAHLLFYANRGPDSASVRIAGPYRTARASTVDTPSVPGVEVQLQKGALEVHLPQVSQYVAVELEA